eukprot:TRINITY_DN13727_c0_g1_i1.p1 TRINITY_DN13727_c0_g1~~TRINITY_DN13727_c0_g1_i1.p1  ORF type:complete len:163 (+),score=34.93 TRINITY_DN13727_c0_g1_i1:96-584(+)
MFFSKRVADMNKIIDSGDKSRGNLWLGDYSAATDIDGLDDNGINTILSMVDFNLKGFFGPLRTHKIIRADDSEDYNMSQHFEECISFIKSALENGNVLVHCAAGISRSASIIVAFLIKEKEMTTEEALAFVRTKREIACPNLGFMEQLRKYEKDLRETITPS